MYDSSRVVQSGRVISVDLCMFVDSRDEERTFFLFYLFNFYFFHNEVWISVSVLEGLGIYFLLLLFLFLVPRFS